MLAALDIGTNKVVTLVADLREDGELEICASGICLSQGMRKGIVVNMEQMVDSIRKSVEEAELMLEDKNKINSVYVGICGEHIEGALSDGMAPIHEGEVSQFDMSNAVATAKTIPISDNQEILHAFPREFMIDGESGIRNPEGMAGRRLEAKVYMITGGKYQILNIKNCIERCGLMIKDIVLEPIASGMAVLTADERELGVCLIDIGGGTTDIAVYTDGEIIDTKIIPVAGDHVSTDIAKVLRTPPNYAEEIKLKYGCTKSRIKNSNEMIEIHALSDDSPVINCKRQTLAEVIEARYDEIFGLTLQHLRKNFKQDVIAGIVLTGGGSKLEGIDDLAKEIFDMPVRVGSPQQLKDSVGNLKDPIYATGFGLLLYAKDLALYTESNKSELGQLKTAWLKTKRWFHNHY